MANEQQAKNTPGPWTIRTCSESSTQEIVDQRCITVCEVGDCSVEDDANARLIAAAPQMLEALLDALAGHNDPELFLPQVRAAIAKATGA